MAALGRIPISIRVMDVTEITGQRSVLKVYILHVFNIMGEHAQHTSLEHLQSGS